MQLDSIEMASRMNHNHPPGMLNAISNQSNQSNQSVNQSIKWKSIFFAFHTYSVLIFLIIPKMLIIFYAFQVHSFVYETRCESVTLVCRFANVCLIHLSQISESRACLVCLIFQDVRLLLSGRQAWWADKIQACMPCIQIRCKLKIFASKTYTRHLSCMSSEANHDSLSVVYVCFS